jgi:hypothetical protein
MPWKKELNSEHRYETIYFLRPVLEDEDVWRQEVVQAYIGAETKYFEKKTIAMLKDLKRKELVTESTIRLAAALKIPL